MQSQFRSNSKKKLMAEINVVPYIDVTLILLIIFMITAPIVQQAVTVDLPDTPSIVKKSQKTIEKPQKPFVITVTKEGQFKTSEDSNRVLGEKDIENLVAEVVARSQFNPKQPFYIQGDTETPYGKIMHLFVTLKANGISQVSLMTEPETN